MSDYSLLVVDVDGTLVNRSGEISKVDREALARARRCGVLVSLSTGRPLRSCISIIEQLSLPGCHIFFDGALVSDPHLGIEVYAWPVSATSVREMIDFARSHEIDLDLFSSTQYFVERETWSTQAHRQYFEIIPTIVSFDGLWHRERIIKGGLVPVTAQDEARAETFARHFGTSLTFSRATAPKYPGVTFINILAPQVSKGRALRSLASHLGVALSRIMAIGDGLNDIPLLSSAGLAIAMGNAHQDLKKVSDHVTLDVEHSGVAAAIDRFLL